MKKTTCGCIVLASAASRKALGLALSLRSVLDFRVVGVFHRSHPYMLSSVFNEKLLVCVDRVSDEWPCMVLEAAAEKDCSLVIPVDYVDVEVLSKHKSLFENQGIALAAPPYEQVVATADKSMLPQLLEGVARTPRTLYVADKNASDKICDLKPPLVVKEVGVAARPSYHLDCKDALLDALKRGPCIVQEYIPGIARGYYVVAYEGEPLLEFTHQRLVEYEPSGGPSLAAKGPVMDPELYRLGRKITAKLGWTGLLMVETKWDPETGEYYVIELNPKFWSSLALPVSLGYHFPAVLAIAYLEGVEAAKKLAKSLHVASGTYSWVLDGIRYLASIPEAWFKLARLTLRKPVNSELFPLDPGRVLSQIATAFKSLPSRRKRWHKKLVLLGTRFSSWVNKLIRILEKREAGIILDLDGTLFKLPVNWARVRAKLVEEGLARKWESVQTTLTRLWTANRGYERASKVIEEFELEVVDDTPALVELGILKELREAGFRLCVATKQASSVAEKLLRQHGFRETVEYIVGRDSGYGPLKRKLFQACMKNIGGNAIVVDDNLKAIVEASRLGLLPMRPAWNKYSAIQALELGVPAASTRELLKLLLRAREMMK